MIHWNSPQWAASAVNTILVSEGVQVELTVIDNPSERSVLLRSALPDTVEIVWRARNDGYTGVANEALRLWQARPDRPEYCVICSHDLHGRPDTFAIMADLLAADPEYGVLGPTVWRDESRGHYPFCADPLLQVEWVPGCCLMLRRSSATGIVFDEAFGSYVEDVDFCLRVSDAGWKIGLATKAEAWELGSASPRAMTLVRANTVRLKVKRRGFPGGLAAISSLIVQGVRSGLGGIALWRPGPQRRDSSNRCRACASALSLVVRPSFWSARTERTDEVLSRIEPSPRECQRSHPDLR